MENDYADNQGPEPVVITSVLIDNITKELKSEPFEINLEDKDPDWTQVEHALWRYQRTFEVWNGFLNTSQLKKLHDLSSRSRKLLQCIEDISNDGLSLILSEELGENGLAAVQNLLETLARMEVKSPRNEMSRRDYTEQHLMLPKGNLQDELDDWWRRVTGLKPEVFEEQGSSPFSFFLSRLFTALPKEVTSSLGTSRTAVEERRRFARNRAEVMKEAAERLNALDLSRLYPSARD